MPLRLVNTVAALPVALPLKVLSLSIPRMGVNLDFLRGHKDRVKTDPELSNHRSIGIALFLECLEKLLGTRSSNRAEVVRKLLTIHSDSMIGKSDRVRFLIGRDIDF